MRWRAEIVRYASDHPGRVIVAAVILIAMVAILCASCIPGEDMSAGPVGALPADGAAPPFAPGPAPSPAQVVEDGAGNRFTAPFLVTVGVGQRGAFRVRMEGAGDQELVLFQTDTLAARFVPLWSIGSRRGSLGPSDFTGLLADAQVLHVEREHFGDGGFHEWSIPVDGKAVGKALVFFLWQQADGTERFTGAIEVRVEP